MIGSDASKYRTNLVAKLSAAIAYVAGSEDADRYALANVLVYHAATKARAIFDHRPSDDQAIYHRLGAYRFGKCADVAAVRYGLNLLARVMVNDHANDLAADRSAGKYNPIAAGSWDATDMQSKIDAELAIDLKNAASYREYQPLVRQLWWQT